MGLTDQVAVILLKLVLYHYLPFLLVAWFEVYRKLLKATGVEVKNCQLSSTNHAMKWGVNVFLKPSVVKGIKNFKCTGVGEFSKIG